jgi:hypothetical protein
MWFTENEVNQIGRITIAGVITEFPISPSVAVSESAANRQAAPSAVVSGSCLFTL